MALLKLCLLILFVFIYNYVLHGMKCGYKDWCIHVTFINVFFRQHNFFSMTMTNINNNSAMTRISS